MALWEGVVVTKDSDGNVIGIVNHHRGHTTGESRYYNHDMTFRVIERSNDRGFLTSFTVIEIDTVLTYRSDEGCLRHWRGGRIIGTDCPQPKLVLNGSHTSRVVRFDDGFVVMDVRGELQYDSALRLIDDDRNYDTPVLLQ